MLRNLEPADVAMVSYGEEEYAFTSAVTSDPNEPQTYGQAINSTNKESWVDAMKDEFKSMAKRQVWAPCKVNNMRDGANVLDTKWVYKLKSDGRYRARLVAKGYNQIPGVDFTESHSPVANDVSIRLVLIICLLNNWTTEQIDVETAFLYGNLDEELYLKRSQGLNEYSDITISNDEVLLLSKAIYGLVQAARAWTTIYIRFLVDKLHFVWSKGDPCLLIQVSEIGIVITTVDVDDCNVVGDKLAVDKCISDIGKEFSIKKLGPIKEYVGAKYMPTGKGYIVHQGALI
jgi:hypothetical protein